MKKWTRKQLQNDWKDAWMTHTNSPGVSAIFQFVLNTHSEANADRLTAIAHTCDTCAFIDDSFVEKLWDNYKAKK